MKYSQTARSRGKLRKTTSETIKRYLDINDLNINMIYDRKLWLHMIHITDPTKWETVQLQCLSNFAPIVICVPAIVYIGKCVCIQLSDFSYLS